MTFHHRPTFLRSLILENPSALGDYFGPEDVLRFEEEFPELFDPVLEPVDNHHNESSKQITTSKPKQKPPISISSSTAGRPKLGNVKSTATTMKKPTMTTTTTTRTTTGKVPFERLSHHTLKTTHCNRERCKPKSDLKPSSSSFNFANSALKPNVQSTVSNLNTKPKYSSLSERILSNSFNNNLSRDNFEYEPHRRRNMNLEKTRVVRVTNRKVPTTASHFPEKLYDKIPSNVKLQNPSSTFSISRKRLVSSPTKTSTSIAYSTPPNTPRFKPVSERHNAQASKSIGFLKPVPILVKKRKNQLPNSKLKTPSPTVKFVEKNVIKGYGINTKTNANSSSHHHHPPYERIQSQSDTVLGGMYNISSNNFLTLPALKKLVEERFGHYLQPPNSNDISHQSKNEIDQNINKQQQKHINENTTKMEQQQQNSMHNNINNNRKDLNGSELSDILEGIETENADSFNSIVTLTSLASLDDEDDEQEGEQKEELHSTIPPYYNNNCNFNSSNVMPRRIINIKSQSLQQIQSQNEEQEEYLTNASVDRCEQLLLAKLLASKYEKDGKFTKSQTPSPRKTTLQPPPAPLHSQLLDNFEKYNKAFEVAVKENPGLLQKIAHELIHTEVKKIMEEEQDNRFNYPTSNGRNEKVISSIDPKKYSRITQQEKIKVQRKSDINEEMKSKYTFTSEYPKYRDASVNVNFLKEVDLKDVSFEIPTPDLTPPAERGNFFQKNISSQLQVKTKTTKTLKFRKNTKDGSKSSSSSCSSSPSPIKTPTLSKMESLVHQIQCLELSVQNKQQQQNLKQKQPLDMTDCDCSELEDFIASEPIVTREKDGFDDDKNNNNNNNARRIIHDIIEECITNIPTPELTTPTISEQSLGRAGELLKQILISPEKHKIILTPQNHHQQIAVASSSQEKRDEEKKAIQIVKDVVKIDMNIKTREPTLTKNPEPKQIIHHHHPSTDEIPCSSTNIIVNNKEEDNDDLFYDYTKEKAMLEEIISHSQSEDDIKRRMNKKLKVKDGKNTNFDDFDFEASDSSLTSILELISDGELILNFNEEKSPGEVSLSGATYPYYNISPGIHQRLESTSEFYDSSTFNAVGIDSNFSQSSQSSGMVNE